MVFLKGKTSSNARSRQEIYKPGHLLPILPALQLLASGQHQTKLAQIQELCGVSSAYYSALYEPLIHQFAEYVQVIPSQQNGMLSGLLNEGLTRAYLALARYQFEQAKQADPLLAYAVFSAALLADIAKVIIQQRIIITDEQGKYREEWYPLIHSMVGRGERFRLYSLARSYQRLQKPALLMLLHQVVPKIGFMWLMKDLQVFADWIHALLAEEGDGGQVAQVAMLIKYEDVLEALNALPQIIVTQEVSPETEHGEAFFNWLKNELIADNIKVNTAEAHVHRVQEGVFLERKLFKQFADVYNVPVSMNVVFAQFGNLLGIAEKGGADFMHRQFFSEYLETGSKGSSFAGPFAAKQKSIREGMVVSDPNLIFMNKNPTVTPMLKSASASSGAGQHALPQLSSEKSPQSHLKS